jgi:uncharacterized membrane protein
MDWTACLDNNVATLRCIPIVFSNVIRAALVFVGVIALLFIIYAGFSFVTSGGDPKKVQGARQTMTFAIIGLIVVLLSFAILFFIGYATNTSSCITSFSNMSTFLTGCK